MNSASRKSLFALIVFGASSANACGLEEFQRMVREGEAITTVLDGCREYLTSRNVDRYQILDWAVRMGDLQLVSSLIQLGYWPDSEEQRDGLIFYSLWAEDDPAEMVALLVANGSSIDGAAREFDIVYHAIELGFTDTLEFFLANMSDKLALYRPANLFAAVRSGNVDLLRKLLDGGVDPNYKDAKTGRTALFLATERGAADGVLQALIERGASCSLIDASGRSALAYAANPKVFASMTRLCEQ